MTTLNRTARSLALAIVAAEYVLGLLPSEERAAFEERAMTVRERFVEMVGGDAQTILDGLVAEIEALETDLGESEQAAE